MVSVPTIAAIRFGAGLAQHLPAPGHAGILYDSLMAEARAQFPPEPFADRLTRLQTRTTLLQASRAADTTPARRAEFERAHQALRDASFADLRASIAELAYARTGFHERLTRFWANHFAAMGLGGALARTRSAYIDAAIRPHVTARFSDMLRAAVLHPVMLVYLDQFRSVGPNSPVGRRQGRGVNENLAREILELHTLGDTRHFTQGDVSQFALLLTGLTVTPQHDFLFDPRIAEPGILRVLGTGYGARRAGLEHITHALDDLARRPETALHIARKLARHFIADDPDAQLVAHIAAAFSQSGGDLMVCYRALLEHPAAWASPLAKTRAPVEFMAAALRALNVPRDGFLALPSRRTRLDLADPLQNMGEAFETVPSPAGYDDSAAYWVTPQALAARIGWAMALVQRWPDGPDPRAFVDVALGDAASDALRRAAQGAETRAQGLAVILASPAFNRR
ncbi:DUF1800 domain-containing protein [Roseinatronobacter sp. NSM]|uniref:DUF1800 domain-containing protein n=1 Tax=Roseinatronobacter sp. NSM TaxID=3457785 RepID=UPI004035E95F